MRWPGAGGDSNLSPLGLEDGKVLIGVSKVMWLSPPALAQGAPRRKSRGYRLVF